MIGSTEVTSTEAMHALELASKAAHAGRISHATALLAVASLLARQGETDTVADLTLNVKESIALTGAKPIQLKDRAPHNTERTCNDVVSQQKERSTTATTENNDVRRLLFEDKYSRETYYTLQEPQAARAWKVLLTVVLLGLVLGFADGLPALNRPGIPATTLILKAGDVWESLQRFEGKSVAATNRPQVALERGQALLQLGDTVAATVSLMEAAHHDCGGGGAWPAARELSLIGEHEKAAEAYMMAFGLGLPRSQWPQVAVALRNAGRVHAAERIEALSRASAIGAEETGLAAGGRAAVPRAH